MNAAAPAVAKPRRAPSRKAVVAVGVAALLALAGAAWIALPKRSVSTDNAYLQADSSVVAPKVAGLVAEVLVAHNQRVRRGQALLRIDAEEFDARVASAQAGLADAQAAASAARAALASLGAEERVAASNLRAVEVSIRAADARNAQAQADRARYENLGASQLVSRSDVERYRTAAVGADSGAREVRAALQVQRDQLVLTRSKRGGLLAAQAQADAAVQRAQAALQLALQNQRNALVRAPVDGAVGDRQAERGDYVQPGTRLMEIVPLDALYVVANFKETQVARILPGQAAVVEVDALPGAKLRGVVDSFAPGSGSQFSLLPFEPGTGNFTKIVQRVPVRIRFDPGQAALERLRPGLSSTVTIRLGAAPRDELAAR
ncbi:MAG: HlyD family secretion protein [Pseudoxanthomonas sp.]